MVQGPHGSPIFWSWASIIRPPDRREGGGNKGEWPRVKRRGGRMSEERNLSERGGRKGDWRQEREREKNHNQLIICHLAYTSSVGICPDSFILQCSFNKREQVPLTGRMSLLPHNRSLAHHHYLHLSALAISINPTLTQGSALYISLIPSLVCHALLSPRSHSLAKDTQRATVEIKGSRG